MFDKLVFCVPNVCLTPQITNNTNHNLLCVFTDDGDLLLSKLFADDDVSRLKLDTGIDAVPFSAEQIGFLTYHRNCIFKA